MTPTPQRNHAFDGLKLLMIIIVVIHHSGYLSGILFHGYMSVELFFMASGYMLMRAAETKPGLSASQYALGRLKKLYPHYALSFLVYFAYSIVREGAPDGAFLLRGLTELLMMQNLGLTADGGFNYPCWYISVLFYVSIALFWAVRRMSRKAFCIAGGALALTVYGYIFATNGGNIEVWHTVLIFHLPVWRGMAGLVTGMLIYLAHQRMDFTRRPVLWQAVELLSLAAILAMMCLPLPTDAPILLCTAALLLAIGSPRSAISRLSDNRAVRFGIRYEYGVFLNHAFVISVCAHGLFRLLHLPGLVACPLLIATVFAYSVATTKLSERLARRWQR